MLLAVDIGNTDTVLAHYDRLERGALWRVPTGKGVPAQALAGVERVAVCSVVPGALESFLGACGGLPVVIAGPDTVPMKVAMAAPENLGADRLLGAWAALREGYAPPLIVVDAGTAVTFDVVDARGRLVGGAIAPGPAAGLAGLRTAVAADLPEVAVARPERAIGGATGAALQSGAYWGCVGAIERTVAAIARDLSARPSVILTGGLAATLAPNLPRAWALEPELTLKGLARLNVHCL